METDIYSFVMNQLEASKGQLPRVSRESGVPYRTLLKIAARETLDPGVLTIQKLADYFRDDTGAAGSGDASQTAAVG